MAFQTIQLFFWLDFPQNKHKAEMKRSFKNESIIHPILPPTSW